MRKQFTIAGPTLVMAGLLATEASGFLFFKDLMPVNYKDNQ